MRNKPSHRPRVYTGNVDTGTPPSRTGAQEEIQKAERESTEHAAASESLTRRTTCKREFEQLQTNHEAAQRDLGQHRPQWQESELKCNNIL